MRVLHIQIGVDSVLETLQGDLNDFACSSKITEDIAVLSSAVFDLELRDAINGAQPFDGERLLSLEYAGAQEVVVCRPKFLYSGVPMNLGGGELSASYKISALQSIFPSTQIVFHLLITDHASYLHSHLNWLHKNDSNRSFTWLPMVEAIRARIAGPNKLCLWNAEDSREARLGFLAEIFGVPAKHIDRFLQLKKEVSEISEEAHISVESDLKSAGADVHFLDEAFETDLEQLQF